MRFFITISVIAALLTGAVATLVMFPFIMKGRVTPGIELGSLPIGGVAIADVPNVVKNYDRALQEQRVTLTVRDHAHAIPLRDVGLQIDEKATVDQIRQHTILDLVRGHRVIAPELTLSEPKIQTVTLDHFAKTLRLPRNASLRLSPALAPVLVPGSAGDGVDSQRLVADLRERIINGNWEKPILLLIRSQAPAVENSETTGAREQAGQLLKNGMALRWGEKEWRLLPVTIRRLISFVPARDPTSSTNTILGIQLDKNGLQEYLKTTIAPEINQPARNARFVLDTSVIPPLLQQLTDHEEGHHLDVFASATSINEALSSRALLATLIVTTEQPLAAKVTDPAALGITTLLGRGESNFATSPRNRIHNIHVGVSRYHGLLLPPQTEFSFNEFLGPVTAAAGFKPELVIKHNVTTPELGGGLCQVSTTIFRAAVVSGLPVTERKNHAYVVRYYGKPGFDATIYPNVTDLKFTNDTPGYMLLQAKIEDTNLVVELWGTSDGREVAIEGPSTYDRRSDGSVKAVLRQKIARAGQVTEKVFYSRYRSAQLFPKVLGFVAPSPSAAP